MIYFNKRLEVSFFYKMHKQFLVLLYEIYTKVVFDYIATWRLSTALNVNCMGPSYISAKETHL